MFARFDDRVRSRACVVVGGTLLLACAVTAHASSAWTRQHSGSMAWLRAVYFLDRDRGWAAGGGGALLTTNDGGKSWQKARRPTEDSLRDIYFSDAENGWLVCERSIYQLKTKDEPRTYLLRTKNGGETWTRVNVIGADADVRLVRALFTNDGRGWAFGEGGALYATRDDGKSWARQRVPTRHLLLGGAIINAEHIWLVGAGATILQTSDGGETWRAGSLEVTNVRFTATSFVDERRGWAVGTQGRVFATTNGGRTWREQESGVRVDLFDVKFFNPMEGWAVGAEGTMIHTTDGGAHWSAEPSGTTHSLERLYFSGPERGWTVGFGGTILAYGPAKSAPKKAPGLKNRALC